MTSELSIAGAALVSDVESYLAAAPAPAPPALAAAPVVVSVEAVERAAQRMEYVRDQLAQMACVPAPAIAYLLGHAQTVLRRDGWVRGSWHAEDGRCLTGAVLAAARELGVAWEVQQAARMALTVTLSAHLGKPGQLIGWNDDLRRTPGEVMSLLASAVPVAYRYDRQDAAA